MSLPYYKRFPRDFLEGTIGLSLEVKGAFAILLDLIYMRSGRLPDDARFISGQLGCSVRKWTAIREELISLNKIQVHGGIISNFRADYLTEETRKYQDKQAEIAKKPRKNNNKQQPEASQSESEPDIIEGKPSIEASPKARRGSKRCPEGWEFKPKHLDFAYSLGLHDGDVAIEADRMRDYTFPRSIIDWDATFRNWLRTAAERKKRYAPRAATKSDHLAGIASAMGAALGGIEGEHRDHPGQSCTTPGSPRLPWSPE